MDLVALAPNVLFASGTLSVSALQRASRSTPIVFANVTDRWVLVSSIALLGPAATLLVL